MGLFSRAIRPPDDILPNDNTAAESAPGTVGPDQQVVPGDPNGVTVAGGGGPAGAPPAILPSAWTGWPADWWPPAWNSGTPASLTDTAWTCIDKNARDLAAMPAYLAGNADSLDAGWLLNPDPDLYSSWFEFAKQLFWDYMLGEAFVISTADYATGYPARFHVVPPWAVNVEMDSGRRRYSIGSQDVSGRMLHIRYQSTTADARGHGPLEVGAMRMVADRVLSRYAQQFAASGGVPASILTHPEELTAEQSAALQQQWVAARQSHIGEPAVLSGGVTHEAIQASPKDMALLELEQHAQSRIAIMLGVPPFLVGLPAGGDPMTYSNVTSLFTYHWRDGLLPMATAVMSALSGWLLPRGTVVELNRDSYVEPEPESRARTAQILNGIVDSQGNPALTVEEIRQAERLAVTGQAGLSGVVE